MGGSGSGACPDLLWMCDRGHHSQGRCASSEFRETQVRGGGHEVGLKEGRSGLVPQFCSLKLGAEDWESLTEVTVKTSGGEVAWSRSTLVLTASSLGSSQGA